MLRLYLDKWADTEVDGGVVGEPDRDAAPVGLVGNRDLGDSLADDLWILVDAMGTTIVFLSVSAAAAPV